MEYNTHTFVNGEVLTADKLNNIVSGIDNIYETVVYEPRVNEPRKAVICFTFDDGRTTDSTVYNIFKEKDMVCSFALPTTVSSRYGEYLEYQKDGFEILSHSTDSTGMSDTSASVSSIDAKLKNSKNNLEAAGFNVTGWVTPKSAMHENYIPSLRKYYDLGFTVYCGKWEDDANGSMIPYNTLTDDLHGLWRVSMESTSVERVKLAIDEAVTNTGYLNFYAHDFSGGLTQAELREILDYAKTYVDAGTCIVTTVTKGYLHYYTLRHSDLIRLLSNSEV